MGKKLRNPGLNKITFRTTFLMFLRYFEKIIFLLELENCVYSNDNVNVKCQRKNVINHFMVKCTKIVSKLLFFAILD